MRTADKGRMRKAAIVPAYNEARLDRGRRRRAPVGPPRVRDRRRRRRLDRRDGRRGSSRRRRSRPASVQPRHRRRRADRHRMGPAARLRARGPGRRRRPARSAADPEAAPARSSPATSDVVVGTRFAGDRHLPRLGRPPHRHHCLRQARLADRPPARHRHDLRLPGDERARDRPLRRRVPLRLPRGRGDRPHLPAQAAPGRGRRSRCDRASRAAPRSRPSARSTTWARSRSPSSSACLRPRPALAK